MKLEVKKIEKKDKSVLANLFQLYMHDITQDLHMDINEHGLFDYDYIDYFFSKDGYMPFMIYVDDKIAGFVLIDLDFMVLEGKEDEYNLSEMFILNGYKGKGIGKKVAFIIFDMFLGTWEVKPVPRSLRAKTFWEKSINEYTKGKFEEKYPKPNRTTFIFSNKKI